MVALKKLKPAKPKLRVFGIYLIKDGLAVTDILRHPIPAAQYPIPLPDCQAVLYVRTPRKSQASWVPLFAQFANLSQDLCNGNTAAVLLATTSSRTFAITFGYGKSLLCPSCWEEDFGLRVSLNAIHPDKIRSISHTSFDAISQRSQIQANTDAAIGDFGLDIERDLLRAVVGQPANPALGEVLAGADPLSASARIGLEELPALLQTLFKEFNSKAYQARYPWLDHIRHATDKPLIEKLNAALLQALNARSSQVWLVVPEIMDWVNLKGFGYSTAPNQEPESEIRAPHFLDTLPVATPLSIEKLKREHVLQFALDTDAPVRRWPVFKCLHAELEVDANTYLLSEGKWFRIARQYYQSVVDFFKSLDPLELDLPTYTPADDGEAAYTRRASESRPERFALMDKNFTHHSIAGTIEFCDLFSSEKQIIHVKRYGGSSRLSHLFAQGIVSGKVFHHQADFRADVNAKLPEAFRLPDPSQKPEFQEYQVVFAIVSDSSKPFDIPFFSKITLRSALEELNRLGYRTAIARIRELKSVPARAAA